VSTSFGTAPDLSEPPGTGTPCQDPGLTAGDQEVEAALALIRESVVEREATLYDVTAAEQ